jgi:hypothetical protein
MKKMLVFGIGVLLSLIMVNGVNSAWFNTSFYRCRNITIDFNYVDSNLTSFPVYVDIDTINSYVRDDWNDIRVVNSGCRESGNLVPYELENYTATTGSLWFNANLTDYQDTVYSVYYNYTNAENQEDVPNVWDSNFSLVVHTNDVILNDSTSNNFLLTLVEKSTPTPYPVSGRFGYGLFVNNSGQNCGGGACDNTATFWDSNFNPNSEIGDQSPYTVEFYLYHQSLPTDLGWYYESPGTPRFYSYYTTSQKQWIGIGTQNFDGVVTSNVDSWNHVVFRYDGTTDYKGFVNKSYTYTANIGAENTANALTSFLGSTGADKGGLNATIDEIRISKTDRSDDWIETSYDLWVGNLVTLGSEEVESPITTTTTSTTTSTTTTTTSTTTTTTTTTTIEGILIEQITDYYCENSNRLIYNLTTWNGTDYISQYNATVCEYNCSETMFGTRCNYSPSILGLTVILALVLGLGIIYIVYKMFEGLFK